MVFPAKYRRVVFDGDVETVLKEVCLDYKKSGKSAGESFLQIYMSAPPILSKSYFITVGWKSTTYPQPHFLSCFSEVV